MPDFHREFLRKLNDIAKHQHRYDVFRDFVTMAAISLHNGIVRDPVLEEEYLGIIGRYSKEDARRFPELLGELVMMLEVEPADVLGAVYLELGLGNDNAGQFFTPPAVSKLMAQVTHGETLKDLKAPFITLSEPACGAGGMVLAFVNVMISEGMNPAERLWVQCIDVDRLAALMCFVQLSLWNVPAEVLVGNTLSMEMRERFCTPAHYLGNWESKLKQRAAVDKMKALFADLPDDHEKVGEVLEAEPPKLLPTKAEEPVEVDIKQDSFSSVANVRPTLVDDQFDFNF